MTAATHPGFLSVATAIAAAGRDLYGCGWLPATSGNLSVRLDRNSFAITVSGRDKGRLTANDIMRVDLAGEPLSPGRPSAETLLHTSLYRWSNDIGAVLHTHGRTSTVLGLRHAGRDRVVLKGYELLKAFAGIETHATRLAFPILENTQDIAALADDVIARLVPAGATHWFDMGPNPHFVAVRLFNNPTGWVARFTGSDIADRFSHLEN
jgi:methylthioribulose-1-phosphate dehydratase